jgi:D-alanyl-D-alanine carboxypeptidase
MKYYKKWILSIILLVFSVGNYQAQINPVVAQELQQTIDSFRTVNNIKGISTCIHFPNQGFWDGVSGVSHATTPIQSDMVFGIGSNTKLFTAVLILKLAESNILNLDDSLHEFLPYYPNIDSNITIRQLLNHTSGLYDVSTTPGYPDSMLTNPNRVFTAAELMTWAQAPLATPGTAWNYCNTNYLLAAMIAESATGMSYHELIRNELLDPLHLDSTFLDVYENSPLFQPHPWQGGMDFSSTPRISINSAAWSAGGMYSTAREMVQWYQAIMNGGFLNANSFNELTTFVGSGNYGLGIAEATINGSLVWYHGGQIWGGYSTSMMYDPASGAVICVLINQLPAQAFQVAAHLLSDLVDQGLGFHGTSQDEAPLLFPNPTTDLVRLNVKGHDQGTFQLSNGHGQLLLSGKVTEPPLELSLAPFPKGVYVLTVQSEKETKRWKILRQ